MRAKFFMRFAPETGFLKFLKGIGLGPEFAIGDVELDKKFYIASDHPKVNRAIYKNPEVIAALKILISAGVEDLKCPGTGNLTLTSRTELDETSRVHLFENIMFLKKFFEDLQKRASEPDPFYWRIIAIESLMIVVGAYGLIGLLTARFGAGPRFIESEGDLIIQGLYVGLGILGFWVLLVFTQLRGSSRFGLIFVEAAFGLILSIFTGVQAAADINQVFDRSQPYGTEAIIVKRYSKTYGSGRNSRTVPYFKLHFGANPKGIPTTIERSIFDSSELVEGMGVKIITREGFFNRGYIEELQPIEAPKAILDSLKQQKTVTANPSGADQVKLKELIGWSANEIEIAQVTAPDSWQEEFHRDGQLRAKEPIAQGVRHGVASYWHENGQLYGQFLWWNGEKHGAIVLYRPDGSVEQRLSYKNGKPHGLCRWYDSKGNLTNLAVYEDGVVVDSGSQALRQLSQDPKL